MKNFIRLFFLLFILESCSIVSKPSTKQKNLNGTVRLLQFKVFEAIEKNGFIVKGTEQSGMFAGNNVTIFDKKGFKKEYIVYAEDNKFKELHKTYKYNRKGLLLEEREYYTNGELMNTSVFKYKGQKDSLSINEVHSSEGVKNYVHKYDASNNIIYMGGNILTYDSKNNLIKEVNNDAICTYEYDDKSNIIKKQYESVYSSIISIFEYINFDYQGNWTKQIEYRKGKPKFICERKIEYY